MVKRWLTEHPGVELVRRDRASAYAEAAQRARQVADCWHLLKHTREAVERPLGREPAAVAAAFATTQPVRVRLPEPLRSRPRSI